MATGNATIDQALEAAKQFIGDMTEAGIESVEFIQTEHFKLQMATAKAETSKQVADAIAAAAR